MALVYAAPYIPVAPPRVWVGLQMTWTGWDGSLWDLTTTAQGAVMMAGVRGLSMPPVLHYLSAFASVDGARWRGNTVEPREVFWPIQLFSDVSSQAWVDRDRAFWRTMRPGKTGIWSVTHPNGDQRHLDCRFSDDSQQSFDLDPVIVGWSNYGINLVAHQPYWRGKSLRSEWATSGASSPFFPTTTVRHYTISPANGLAGAAVMNPGDVDVAPIWELYGPFLTAHVGILDELVEVPFAVAANEVLIIDCAPTAQTATLWTVTGTGTSRVLSNPVDKIAALGPADFCRIPADATSPVNVVMDGTGTVALTIVPLYFRAW